MVRSDAQRNVERLKAAAVEVFQERGLSAPLEEIDAVVPDLARANVDRVLAHVRDSDDDWERVRRLLTGLLDMQIADPALSDAISSAYAASPQTAAVCGAALDEGARVLDAARASGTVRSAFGRDDLGALLVANAAIIGF